MKKEQLVKPKNIIYCQQCGSQMLEELVGAERIIRHYGIDCVNPESPYDEETGKRNYAYKYTCPNKKWWNKCYSFVKDEVIL